jgi:hypothetical protein
MERLRRQANWESVFHPAVAAVKGGDTAASLPETPQQRPRSLPWPDQNSLFSLFSYWHVNLPNPCHATSLSRARTGSVTGPELGGSRDIATGLQARDTLPSNGMSERVALHHSCTGAAAQLEAVVGPGHAVRAFSRLVSGRNRRCDPAREVVKIDGLIVRVCESI